MNAPHTSDQAEEVLALGAGNVFLIVKNFMNRLTYCLAVPVDGDKPCRLGALETNRDWSCGGHGREENDGEGGLHFLLISLFFAAFLWERMGFGLGCL